LGTMPGGTGLALILVLRCFGAGMNKQKRRRWVEVKIYWYN